MEINSKEPTILWFSPREILRTWGTSDSSRNDYKGIRRVMKEKREDYSQYHNVLESIDKHGFLCPLSFRVIDGKKIHHEGHHRLTAAIDLGHKRIPYVEVKFWTDSRSKTTPEQYLGKTIYTRYSKRVNPTFVHPKNPVPKAVSQQV